MGIPKLATFVSMPSDLEIAYLAGVLDSDGSIFIARRAPTQSSRHITTSYYTVVAVAQTHPQALNLFAKCFGGQIRKVLPCKNQKATLPHRRPIYCWTIYTRSAARCVQVLAPYLRIKTAQASIALQLVATYDNARYVKSSKYGWACHPDDVFKKQRLWEEMRKLNVTDGKGHHRPQKQRLFS